MRSLHGAPRAGAAPEPSLRPLHGHEAVLAASGGDPFVRFELPMGYTGPAVGVDLHPDGTCRAVAFVRTGTSRRTSLTVIGEPAPVDRLLAGLLASDLGTRFPLRAASVPQSCAQLLARYFTLSGEGGDWDWMWTTMVPPVFPGETDLVQLDDEQDAAGIRALLTRGNPHSHGHPGEGVTERWLGLRDASGRPVACAALHRNGAGIPHLSGITVTPELRGRGWGRALTAALTRQAVGSDGVCTLGMFSDNAVARRLYHGLGYRTAWAWASRSIEGSGPAPTC